MSAQPDLFRKPAPRAGACARAPGLRTAVWALFSDGMHLTAQAVAAIVGADVNLVHRRIDDLRRDGFLEADASTWSASTARFSTIWRKSNTMTFDLERIPDRQLSQPDKIALGGLDEYIEQMKSQKREPQPRLRIEQYDRFFKLAKRYNAACTGLTYKGLRVIGGGMSA
jgi:DNA-binding transcriptional regulator YbjK